jgi:hypothetical protein
MGSDLIIAFRINPADEDCVFYFATEHSTSAAGEQLAKSVSSVVGGRVEGRASAMLKETRAPAAVVSHRRLDEKLGVAVVQGLAEFFATASSKK